MGSTVFWFCTDFWNVISTTGTHLVEINEVHGQ